jgi:RNA polymerase sigma-70 factor (ECF subfamily)
MVPPAKALLTRMDQTAQQAASTIDPRLIARIAKGDQQAFTQLYDLSSTVLFTLAFRMLGTREEAAELLQDVYLEVWRKVSRYDVGRGTPIAWLVTLTRSRAIDRLRTRGAKTQRLSAPLDDAAVGQMPDYAPTPFEAQADVELRTAVSSAIAELPDAQQQVIAMAFYEGLSHAEIAAKLNQPLGTIKTRIKLGMTKLRAALRGTWGGNEGS